MSKLHPLAASVVFVDARLSNLQSLLSSLPAGSEVALLDSASDGLAQVTAVYQDTDDLGVQTITREQQ